MDLQLEESLWKDIPTLEDYQAHPSGEIRNKITKRIYQTESLKHRYRYVLLNKKSYVVHRLIALTFCENPNPKTHIQVNHIDNNKRNNSASNLEWKTPSDNVKQAVAAGRKDPVPTRKTPIEITYKDGTVHKYDSLEDAAKKMGIKRHTITSCLTSDGIYCGIPGLQNKDAKWLWKVKRIPQNETVCIEKNITLEGFTDFIACYDGRVLNKNRKCLGTNDGQYLRVKGKNGKSKAAHILIALTFIENPDNKPYVNHKDGNKLNNSVENLEWCTQQENMQHARKTGLISKDAIKRQGDKTKVPVYQLELNGKIIKKFNSVQETETVVNLNTSLVSTVCAAYLSDCKSGRNSCFGYGWCYVKDYTEPIVNKSFQNLFPELATRNDIDFDKIRKYILIGSRPVWQIDLDGHRIKLWDSTVEIENNIPNTSVSNIWKSIESNGNYSSGSYFWEKATYDEIINPDSVYEKKIPELIRRTLQLPNNIISLKPETVKLLRENISQKGDLRIKTRPIVQTDLNDKIIKFWPGPNFARLELNLGRNRIEGVIYKKCLHVHGFKWRFMFDEEL